MEDLFSSCKQSYIIYMISDQDQPGICPLCRSHSIKLKYPAIKSHGHKYDVYECQGCGLGITHPFPDPEHLANLYSGENYRDKGRRFIGPIESAIKWLRGGRLRKIEAHATKGHLLDVGCGRGLMLAMAEENGWQVTGVEYNDETASHARDDLGINMRTGSISDIGFKPASFDAITLWHSLEHMPDAVDVVREAGVLLKPGGLLLISVPNFNSLQSRMSGRHWFHLDVPFHLYHFNTGNLKRLLKCSNMEVVKVEHLSIEMGPFGILQSMLNMSGTRHNLFYDMLKTGKLKGSGSLAETILTYSLLPFAGIASLILTVIEVITKRGGSINIIAKKSPLIKERILNPSKYSHAVEASSFMKQNGHHANKSS
jgi:SAM-dependent methyltransferase